MNPNEFFYWLQGFFELRAIALAGHRLSLSSAQAECIGRHINLVMAWMSDGKKGGGAHPQTIARLHEVRTYANLLTSERPEETRWEFTESIIKITAAQFEHVIDPQAGDAETQAKLNNIHGGHPQRPDDKPVYRC